MLRRIVLALVTSVGAVATAAAAKPPLFDPPLLFGAGGHRIEKPAPIDPRLPTGAGIAAVIARPADREAPACSFRLPVCVHRGRGVAVEQARLALVSLENAYDRLVLALALPAPRRDWGLGGSDALDLYLDRDSPEPITEHDAPELGGFDSASGFCVAPPADAVTLERSATLCVGEAIAWRIDAALSPFLRRAFASELWWITGLPLAADVEGVDAWQQSPDRAPLSRERSPASDGAATFFDFLETTRSTREPGQLSAALLWLSAARTEPGAFEWNDEPDPLDVLRHTLDEDTIRMANLVRELGRARAFLGDRDDGTHPPFLEWAGRFARPRYDWVIPFSSLPRRVKSGRPLEPFGVELVWLDLDQVPQGASLGFEAEWEAPVAFAWSLVRIDAQGREIGRVDIPFQERGRSAEGRVVDLAGARSVLVVGVNMGGVDLAHPFDPDVAPFEPHACLIYLARL